MKFEPEIITDDEELAREVQSALESVDDPELHVDVWTLELIRKVEIEDAKVDLLMTFTTPFCPYGPQLLDDIKGAVSDAPGVQDVEIELTFEKRWEPSPDLKALLGIPI